MKKYINGKYVEMTAEELAELETARKEYAEQQKNTPPTETERLEALEQAFMEFVEVMVNG